jgi:hypothetical protein
MKPHPIHQLSALICVICGLILLPLTTSAANKVVTSSLTESGSSYNDTATDAALRVTGSGVYVQNQAALSLTGGAITSSGSFGHGINLTGTSSGTLSDVNIQTTGIQNHGVYTATSSTLTLTGTVSIGDGILVDFGGVTVGDGDEFIVLDWNGATLSGGISETSFTAVNLGPDMDGIFTVANNQLTFNASAIPEPSTWFLFGTGLGLLLLTAHRRRQARTDA